MKEIKNINEMLELLHKRNIQSFRGDATNENKCYEYFEKLGCIFFGNMGDFQASMHNLEIVLTKLQELENAKTSP